MMYFHPVAQLELERHHLLRAGVIRVDGERLAQMGMADHGELGKLVPDAQALRGLVAREDVVELAMLMGEPWQKRMPSSR